MVKGMTGEAFNRELRQYLEPFELRQLEEAQRNIAEYELELKKRKNEYLELIKEADEIGEEIKAKAPSHEAKVQVGILSVKKSLLESFPPRKPTYAYETLEKLKRGAAERKAKQELDWEEEEARQKAESERQREAKTKAKKYAQQLRNNVGSFKASLCQTRRNLDNYFKKDPRYLGYSLAYLPQNQKKACEEIVGQQIKASIPENLRPFLSFKYRLAYRLLPHVEYSLIDDVPSLDFGLSVFVVTEIEYWLKSAQVSFGSWNFTMPTLEKPELLGYAYKLFTSDDLNAAGYYFWQTIPCILIQGLLQGNIEPQSTRITEVSESSTSYEINGFDEEISIPDTFSKYLKAIGSWQGLVEKGIISSKVGEVVARAMERSTKELSSPETPKLSKGSKKARAFQLFNEGKRPGDPKVKSLGIKPETAYRYYQDWKKVQHSSQNAT